ncbi:MAG: DUF11 domain-containing protein [Armatimonadetes bacterium]|nr:DUF11 domain-containing protein [Armatimonadota bacterium]
MRNRCASRLALAALAALSLVIATGVFAREAHPPKVTATVTVDRADTDIVRPGEVLTYTVAGVNRGEGTAHRVAITNPVPEGTTYVPGSAAGRGMEIRFSIDGGKSFQSWPIRVRDPRTGRDVEARADRVTHVRWGFTQPLGPGERVAVSYQVRVK